MIKLLLLLSGQFSLSFEEICWWRCVSATDLNKTFHVCWRISMSKTESEPFKRKLSRVMLTKLFPASPESRRFPSAASWLKTFSIYSPRNFHLGLIYTPEKLKISSDFCYKNSKSYETFRSLILISQFKIKFVKLGLTFNSNSEICLSLLNQQRDVISRNYSFNL